MAIRSPIRTAFWAFGDPICRYVLSISFATQALREGSLIDLPAYLEFKNCVRTWSLLFVAQ